MTTAAAVVIMYAAMVMFGWPFCRLRSFVWDCHLSWLSALLFVWGWGPLNFRSVFKDANHLCLGLHGVWHVCMYFFGV